MDIRSLLIPSCDKSDLMLKRHKILISTRPIVFLGIFSTRFVQFLLKISIVLYQVANMQVCASVYWIFTLISAFYLLKPSQSCVYLLKFSLMRSSRCVLYEVCFSLCSSFIAVFRVSLMVPTTCSNCLCSQSSPWSFTLLASCCAFFFSRQALN